MSPVMLQNYKAKHEGYFNPNINYKSKSNVFLKSSIFLFFSTNFSYLSLGV